jgi:hypothetical protein
MKTIEKQPTVEELNDIQAQWMALDYNAPVAERNRVFALMKQLPKRYVSGHDGKGVCVVDSGPLCQTVSFDYALELCAKHGGRTDIAWNGKLGQWYALQSQFQPA